jgi:alpha-beta hydrolase superfamily lysophospholipase
MLPLNFDSSDGTPIHGWAVLPAGDRVRAKVILVHGFGTHSDSLHFRFLRDHLTARGIAVCGCDLRGFGRSGGRRASVRQWQDFRGDLALFVREVEQTGPAVPMFLLGVSMGGLIAVNYALHHPEPLRGVIAMSPALDSSGVPAWRRILVRALANIAPALALNTGLDVTRLTRDQDAQRTFLRDPLSQRRMTLRLASQITAAIVDTEQLLPRLDLPLLILQGSADVIVPPAGAARLHQLAGSADKELLLFEGAFHVLSMETNRDEVFECIGSWIEKRSGPAGAMRPE